MCDGKWKSGQGSADDKSQIMSYVTWSRVFIVSMGVVITEEQAPAIIPAVAWTVTISMWDGFFCVLSP